MTDKQETPRTNELLMKLRQLFARQNIEVSIREAFLLKGLIDELVNAYRDLECELAALRASIEAAELPEEPKHIVDCGIYRDDGRRAACDCSYPLRQKAYYDTLRAKLAAVMVENERLRQLVIERDKLNVQYAAERDALQSKLSAAYAAVRDADKYGDFRAHCMWHEEHKSIIAVAAKDEA